MEGFEVPLAARSCNGGPSFTARHLAVSRETIMKLANSLPASTPGYSGYVKVTLHLFGKRVYRDLAWSIANASVHGGPNALEVVHSRALLHRPTCLWYKKYA
jgi:hypothetical protein